MKSIPLYIGALSWTQVYDTDGRSLGTLDSLHQVSTILAKRRGKPVYVANYWPSGPGERAVAVERFRASFTDFCEVYFEPVRRIPSRRSRSITLAPSVPAIRSHRREIDASPTLAVNVGRERMLVCAISITLIGIVLGEVLFCVAQIVWR